MKYFKLVKGDWTICNKENLTSGERFKSVSESGTVLISYYSEDTVNNKIVVTSHQDRIISSVNTSINVSVEIRDPDNNIITQFNDTFAMPVERVNGAVEKTIGMTFVDGVCNKTITFEKSGEYRVTEDLINMHLPQENKLSFDGISISIYE